MSGYFWVFVGALVVATTKYLTAMRLRNLSDRVHREHADTGELRQELNLVSEKGSQLNKEVERLRNKVQGMRSVVTNLERTLQRHTRSGAN